MTESSETTARFRAARDQLLALQQDVSAARGEFQWPRFETFNFGLNWFDHLAASPERAEADALVIVEADGSTLRRTFAQLSEDSNRLARWFTAQGMRPGDRLILMLGNQVELWETMLACIKMGVVLVPTTTQMGSTDLADRVERAGARWAVAEGPDLQKFDTIVQACTLIRVPGRAAQPAAGISGDAVSGHPVLEYAEAYAESAQFSPEVQTGADDTMLLYFTSGTTSRPKLVEHTHTSYPVGHLSTLYWIGLEPGDVHMNVASPGWAKHAWSTFFAPWIAEATICVYNFARFDAADLMRVMDEAQVSSFCAPPTVWRMLIKADLTALKTPPKKTVSAGEPLNAEVIEQVHRGWGCTVRDGFGQTESTLQVANTPGQRVTFGAMGVPLPGYDVVVVDPTTGERADEGELCLSLDPRPVGLMRGYYGDEETNARVFRDGLYHTGDVVSRDERGTLTYVGRTDDVFKSSDYKISPFELESVLVEHPAVLEAAIVPSPDELRLSVPKAFVTLAAGWEPTPETARQLLSFAREKLPGYKRIRRIEFRDLPKTISGKIRRVELRDAEAQRVSHGDLAEGSGVDYSDSQLRGR